MSITISNSTVINSRNLSTTRTERMLAKFAPSRDYFPWASIAALLTSVAFSVSLFSMLLSPADYNLFAKVYFLVGFVINFAGLHFIRSGADYPFVMAYFILYLALFSGLIYQAFSSTFLVTDQVKAYLIKQCLLQFEKVSENDCAGLGNLFKIAKIVAAGQANSEILTYVFLILIMGVFSYWIGVFVYNVKNPAAPEYEEEFGKFEEEEFELPLYDAGYAIPPPIYHNPDSIEVVVGDTPYVRSLSLDVGISQFLAVPEPASRSAT